ncbi:MAG: MBL fold metallo-hydrolase [Oscillospiraceae bacterium]|jgi:metallo-beta-lactamase family protein|nr:MBL fold metallo-hydrolase [Oscillospiraceae bacterium]
MKVTFLGATHEVTGSCTLLEVGGKSLLVDCGMEQGSDTFENKEIPVNPSAIDAVLLTHAHIDHSGKLPLLFKNGFAGSVYATEETVNLCRIMLMDSAHIQEQEAQWRSRKAQRAGEKPYEPLYDTNDARLALEAMAPCRYGEKRQILENVTIRFSDIGHLLGSACIEIFMSEDGVERKIVFSGDVGNKNKPILKEPVLVEETDYLVIESTYGDRLHEKAPFVAPILADCIERALDRGGNVVIPSFAVGRTQELLYLIRQIKQDGLVHGHDGFPVYVDSPMANEATAVFLQSNPDCFDSDTRALLEHGTNPLVFPGLHTSVSAEESKAINLDSTPKVILSASGMCEAGRIRHHLKHNLWRPESIILFVGYQSEGTLGRALLDGAKSVKLFGEQISVAAEIANMPGSSGHADKQGLLDWAAGFKRAPKRVFVNHGEDAVVELFAQTLRDERSLEVEAPYSGTSWDLMTDSVITRTTGIKIIKPEPNRGPSRDERSQRALGRLISACEALLRTARASSGRPNKDLARFAEQVEQLEAKWDR